MDQYTLRVCPDIFRLNNISSLPRDPDRDTIPINISDSGSQIKPRTLFLTPPCSGQYDNKTIKMELRSMRKAKSSGSPHQSDGGKPSQVAPAPWHGLPLTVQQQILRELSTDYDHNRAKDKKHRAGYAAVCLEWQEYFEASNANFGKLVLHPSALEEFQQIIQRRQKNRPRNSKGDRARSRKRRKFAASEDLPSKGHRLYIRHIWLRVELQEYNCKNCKKSESGKERVRYIFSSDNPLMQGSC